MKTFWTVVVFVTIAVTVTIITFLILQYFREKPGGIYVDTNPVSSIYINGVLVGKTPFRSSFITGEIDLKFIPDFEGEKLLPYETKISLVSGVETVVRREFGKDEDESSGEIMTFNKTNSHDASLYVISIPNYAQVAVDSVPKGFTPYNNTSISSSEHKIIISSPGYTSRTITVKTIADLRLTLFAKLAKISITESNTQTIQIPKSYVEILKSSAGFVRMRTKPGGAGEEIAELKTGSKYLYLDTDVASGWYLIQYQTPAPGLPNGITGWVSNEYSKRIESN